MPASNQRIYDTALTFIGNHVASVYVEQQRRGNPSWNGREVLANSSVVTVVEHVRNRRGFSRRDSFKVAAAALAGLGSGVAIQQVMTRSVLTELEDQLGRIEHQLERAEDTGAYPSREEAFFSGVRGLLLGSVGLLAQLPPFVLPLGGGVLMRNGLSQRRQMSMARALSLAATDEFVAARSAVVPSLDRQVKASVLDVLHRHCLQRQAAFVSAMDDEPQEVQLPSEAQRSGLGWTPELMLAATVVASAHNRELPGVVLLGEARERSL